MKISGIYTRAVLAALITVGCLSAYGLSTQADPSVTCRDMFNKAGQLYREKKYDEAISEYEKIIRLGYESGSLYYNLGNSYFKDGKLGMALVNYERARQLMSSDSDLIANRDYAISLLTERLQGENRNIFKIWIDRIFEGFSIDALTLTASIIMVLIFLVLTMVLFSDWFKAYYKPIHGMLFIFLVISIVSLDGRIRYFTKGAIVVMREAQVKFEPLERATVYFTLSEGNTVEIVDSSDNWYKIKRPDGKVGWVNRADVAKIRPG